MSNSSQVFKLILEFELTGNEVEFIRCQELSDSFVESINQAMWSNNPTCRSARCVKIKRVKTHADVQLPLAHVNQQDQKQSVGK